MDSENIYEIKLQIKTTTLLGKLHGFLAKQANIEQYNPTRSYKTKNEALDATILHLETLKER